ncbi:metal ABC transporter permease [Acaryochloris sp. CCMEE 5410]|uniref:metal ABC transporter permease n=1 Tax=Acaryochloris sp. CCMEE 5410 TaxID=310037 RepID=UPI00024840ED|nr:metal ABC transporter permease [Acaryochloris sp. CCMEE 5410]
MSLASEITRIIDLFQFPFMQRAVISGVLTGLAGGMLGSFTILRQLSFFSDALGHSTLLGLSFGILLGWNPTAIVLPFAVLFALGVTYLLERTRLWTDALLNIVYSSSLALAVIVLSFTGTYKGGIHQLLFGDILAVHTADLFICGGLLLACALYMGLTFRTQMLITLNEPLAVARGVSVSFHRTTFIVLLALVVGISIKAVGVLLISAFIVIPACASRLLCRQFKHHIVLSASLGAISAVVGMLLSAGLNLPSGPSIVIAQLGIFVGAMIYPQLYKAFA